MTTKYTKAFESYWTRTDPKIYLPEIHWLHSRVKDVAFRAWMAGRKKLRDEKNIKAKKK